MPQIETNGYTAPANDGQKPLRGTIVDLLLRFSYEHDEKVAAAEAAEESASERI